MQINQNVKKMLENEGLTSCCKILQLLQSSPLNTPKKTVTTLSTWVYYPKSESEKPFSNIKKEQRLHRDNIIRNRIFKEKLAVLDFHVLEKVEMSFY